MYIQQGSKVDINLRGNTTTFTNLLPENLEPYEKLHPSQTIQQYFTIDGYCAKHNLKLLHFFHEFNGMIKELLVIYYIYNNLYIIHIILFYYYITVYLLVYYLSSGRFFKANKKVGGPRGIVTPAWYLWRNRNEATVSDDHLRFHNHLSVRIYLYIIILCSTGNIVVYATIECFLIIVRIIGFFDNIVFTI